MQVCECVKKNQSQTGCQHARTKNRGAQSQLRAGLHCLKKNLSSRGTLKELQVKSSAFLPGAGHQSRNMSAPASASAYIEDVVVPGASDGPLAGEGTNKDINLSHRLYEICRRDGPLSCDRSRTPLLQCWLIPDIVCGWTVPVWHHP